MPPVLESSGDPLSPGENTGISEGPLEAGSAPSPGFSEIDAADLERLATEVQALEEWSKEPERHSHILRFLVNFYYPTTKKILSRSNRY